MIWKKTFGFILPSTEEEKEEEGKGFLELESQDDDELGRLEEEVRKLVEGSRQQDVVTIEDVHDSSPYNQNILTKEDLKNAQKNTSGTSLP